MVRAIIFDDDDDDESLLQLPMALVDRPPPPEEELVLLSPFQCFDMVLCATRHTNTHTHTEGEKRVEKSRTQRLSRAPPPLENRKDEKMKKKKNK